MKAGSIRRAPSAAAWAALELRLHALRQTIEWLDDNGIRSLPVKGALLARQLYDDPAERPLVDVDLLVKPRDFCRLIALARSKGLSRVWDSKQIGNVNLIVFGTAIDISSSLGPPFTSALGVKALLDRASLATEPLGFRHLRIELHDHALVVAIDAFKDKLGSKASSREDLLRMAALPAFEPHRLALVAREAQLEALVAIVASWLLDENDSPGWRQVLEELGPIRREGYARLFRMMSRRRSDKSARIPLALMARAASDSPYRRFMALALGGVGTLAFIAQNRGLSVKPPPPS